MNKENPWPSAFQWFGFYEDGSLVTTGSTDYTPVSVKSLEETFSILKARGFKYEFAPDGLLVVTAPDSPDYQEVWGVNLITEEIKSGEMDVKPGDLLMSLAGGEDGGPVYFRHLRRVE